MKPWCPAATGVPAPGRECRSRWALLHRRKNHACHREAAPHYRHECRCGYGWFSSTLNGAPDGKPMEVHP